MRRMKLFIEMIFFIFINLKEFSKDFLWVHAVKRYIKGLSLDGKNANLSNCLGR